MTPTELPPEVTAALAQAMIPPNTECDDDPRMAGIIENLRHVYDPEIPTNVYELGLIYEIRVHADNHVHIAMTLTSPNCPVAGELPVWVREAAEKADGVGEGHVTVNLTWDPPWNPTMMSDTAKLQLNMY